MQIGQAALGNLATAACQQRVQAGLAQIAGQVLIYPGVNFTGMTPSRARFSRGYFLTGNDIAGAKRLYAPDETQWWDPRISPALADDAIMGGQPPTLMVTAGFDPLRDEGAAYAGRLERLGVPTRQLQLDAMVHGFINFTGVVPAAARATDDLLNAWAGMVA